MKQVVFFDDFEKAGFLMPVAAVVNDFMSSIRDNDSIKFSEYLANYGEKIADAVSEGGETPLMRAALMGTLGMMHALLDRGANVNRMPPGAKMTALGIAVCNANAEMVTLLVERGADVNLIGAGGSSPLERVCVSALLRPGSEIGIANMLLSKGAKPDLRGENGATPLMSAAECGLTEYCLLLFNKSADTELRDNNGRSALDRARAGRQNETIAALEQAIAARDEAIQENEIRNFGAGVRKPFKTRGPLRLMGGKA